MDISAAFCVTFIFAQHINLTSINKSVIYVNKFQPFSYFMNVPDNVIWG